MLNEILALVKEHKTTCVMVELENGRYSVAYEPQIRTIAGEKVIVITKK